MESQYDIHISSANIDEIASVWIPLESVAVSNVFLSWLWMKTWLEVIKPKVNLITIKKGGNIVGLGLMTSRQDRRYGVLRSRVLRLGRTGNSREDQIWPEYAGLLMHPEDSENIPRAFMSYLLKEQYWDELELAAMTSGQIAAYINSDCDTVEQWSAPTYGVDLVSLKEGNQRYLQSLSRNTRYQISRCDKHYKSMGSLEFRVLSSPEAISEAWPQMSDLHRSRWQHTLEGSGFSNPIFTAFHKQLIREGCAQHMIEVCVLKLDNKVLGYLYNFIYQKRVYFYLSALVNEDDSRLKPGLLLHAYAIEHYCQRHLQYYDFMGGDSQYKRSLGQSADILQVVSLQRKRLKFMLERSARSLKRSIKFWEHK